VTTSSYSKPFLPVDEQLERIIDRGLVVEDRERAYRELQAIGYYRLSGYWYSFRLPPERDGDVRTSEFAAGATFDEVLEIYRFDERLRVEMLHALSQIEVALRFRVGHLLGKKGQFAHRDGKVLSEAWSAMQARRSSSPNCVEACTWQGSDHDEWVRKQDRNEEISSEAFIAHFHSNYGMPLPIWTATEVMSFGDLNRLFGGMTQRDRQQIAVELDVFQEDGNGDAAAVSNWLEHLRQTRNFCAHAARLWNRNHTVPLNVPSTIAEMDHLRDAPVDLSGARAVSRPASRIYGTLVLVAYLMARIEHTNETRNRLRTLVEVFAASRPGRLHNMGFPEGWHSEKIWQPGYERDERLAEQAVMLRDVTLLYTADAAHRLTVKPSETRHSLLNYYRKNGAVLSVPGTGAHRHPDFQFDSALGDVIPEVIVANRRLLDGGRGTEEQRWRALRWWTSPNVGVPQGLSPMRALAADILTLDLLDSMLEPRPDEDR
jgi:abortive infection bacteriophage resistance protein